jgi:uncharacterized protein YecA (UPF0149 family)
MRTTKDMNTQADIALQIMNHTKSGLSSTEAWEAIFGEGSQELMKSWDMKKVCKKFRSL